MAETDTLDPMNLNHPDLTDWGELCMDLEATGAVTQFTEPMPSHLDPLNPLFQMAISLNWATKRSDCIYSIAQEEEIDVEFEARFQKAAEMYEIFGQATDSSTVLFIGKNSRYTITVGKQQVAIAVTCMSRSLSLLRKASFFIASGAGSLRRQCCSFYNNYRLSESGSLRANTFGS